MHDVAVPFSIVPRLERRRWNITQYRKKVLVVNYILWRNNDFLKGNEDEKVMVNDLYVWAHI